MKFRVLVPLIILFALAGTAAAQEKNDNPLKDDPETVVDTLHVRAGKPFLVEVLTWKDHNAPDHAPDEVNFLKP